MRTAKHYQSLLLYAVLATVAVVVLGPGWAMAAYDQDNQQQYQSQRSQDQQQYQDQDQGDQSYRQQSRSTQAPGRDMRLEQQIASRLRQQGYGTQGEIMILATGNRIILLGTVPDNRTKDGAEKAAKQIATRQSIDNRLHVRAQARRISDEQLAKDTNDKLSGELSENVQVQARNGTVTLQGQLDNWRQVADAIDAAFAAGASQVNSQFSVAGAGAMARGEAAGGYYPPYGYAPGPQGQPPYAPRGRQGAMAGQQATSTDVRLAQQVADQLRQQLPQRQNVQPIQAQSIYVTVRQGTVILHGYVQNSSQKQQAEQIVRSIQGVRNVQNDIAILSTRGGAGQGGGQMGSQQGFGGTSTQSESQQGFGGTSSQGGGYGTTGDQSRSQQDFGGASGQSRSASSADRRLAQTVQQQLQNQFPDANINVTARQGTITLRGTVQDDSAKQEAEQIAQSVSGVQNVQNNLRISREGGAYQPQGYIPGESSQSQQGMSSQDESASQSGSQQSYGGVAGQSQYDQGGQAGAQQGFGSQSQYSRDEQMGGRQAGQMASDIALAQKVVQQLKQQLTGVQNIQIMRPGTIYVMAAQGTVMLHGFVQDNRISQQAMQIARAVPGVRNIQSTLRAGAAAGGQAFGYIPGQEQQGQQGAAGQGMQGQNQSRTGRNQGTQSQNQGMTGQNQGTQGSAQMRFIGKNAQAGADQPSQGATDRGMYGRGQDTTGQTATGQMSQADVALAQQVAQKLRQQLTGIRNVQVIQLGTIYVMVRNGTVTLNGFVANSNSKQQAERIAKSVSGIRSVKNSLDISGAAGGPALGYIPGEQDQRGAQQYGEQQPENELGSQSFGYTPPDEEQSEMGQYENEQFGNEQSGDISSGDEQSFEGQAGDDQPDEGTN